MATKMANIESELRRIVNELRTYNPAADEYKGEHIHKGWARQIEAVLSASSAATVSDGARVPDERAAFELFVFDNTELGILRDAHGFYVDERVSDWWKIWQARAASSATREAESK